MYKKYSLDISCATFLDHLVSDLHKIEVLSLNWGIAKELGREIVEERMFIFHVKKSTLNIKRKAEILFCHMRSGTCNPSYIPV